MPKYVYQKHFFVPRNIKLWTVYYLFSEDKWQTEAERSLDFILVISLLKGILIQMLVILTMLKIAASNWIQQKPFRFSSYPSFLPSHFQSTLLQPSEIHVIEM